MLINGNSTEALKSFEQESVHAIISDIPYGIGHDDWDILHSNTNSSFGGYSKAQGNSTLFKRRGKPLNGWSEADKKIPLEYQQWVASWAGSWFNILKPGGTAFIFAGRRYAHRVITALEDVGFTFKDMLAWERDKAPHRAQRISSIYERRGDKKAAKEWSGWRVANLRPVFEPVLWFQKPYPVGKTIADNVLSNALGAWNEKALVKYNANSGILNQSNILRVKVCASDRGLHPAQKPINLMELLIELVTKKGQIVVDPFAGSGTTLLAAQKLGRSYIGFEADSDIYAVAKQRLEENVDEHSNLRLLTKLTGESFHLKNTSAFSELLTRIE